MVWGAIVGFILISLLTLNVLSMSYPAFAANPLLLSNLRVLNDSSKESKEIIIDSEASFSVTISNNNASTQPFIAIFDIRDSNKVSISFMIEEGTTAKYTTTFVRASWVPDALGSYTVRSFVLSDSELPEVLSPVITTKFQIVEEPELVIEEEEATESSSNTIDDVPKEPTLTELKEYALQRINEDREKFGLAPVSLSDNQAAQVHAEDIFENRYLSHWMSNGEKPYMTYSRLGGEGYVNQNIAYVGYDDYEQCADGTFLCPSVDPLEAIDSLEHDMIYDDASSNWGHRDNILDEYHTHVSIGIAHDHYYFAFVQNFENIYLSRAYEHDTKPVISFDGRKLTIEGQIKEGQFSPLLDHANTITISYDPLPTANEYEKNKVMDYYDEGKYIACILQEQLTMYCPDVITMSASSWNYNQGREHDTFLIRANLDEVLDEEGVYTIMITAEPRGAKENDEAWRAMSYSIVYKE
jgi:uncharacterized protein YkwD